MNSNLEPPLYSNVELFVSFLIDKLFDSPLHKEWFRVFVVIDSFALELFAFLHALVQVLQDFAAGQLPLQNTRCFAQHFLPLISSQQFEWLVSKYYLIFQCSKYHRVETQFCQINHRLIMPFLKRLFKCVQPLFSQIRFHFKIIKTFPIYAYI